MITSSYRSGNKLIITLENCILAKSEVISKLELLITEEEDNVTIKIVFSTNTGEKFTKEPIFVRKSRDNVLDIIEEIIGLIELYLEWLCGSPEEYFS